MSVWRTGADMMGGAFHTEPAELPILPGAYVLIVELATEATVPLPKGQGSDPA